jgi:hypothetical protein
MYILFFLFICIFHLNYVARIIITPYVRKGLITHLINQDYIILIAPIVDNCKNANLKMDFYLFWFIHYTDFEKV